jgi:glycosyltransferase involved in cell wall biosynthesis
MPEETKISVIIPFYNAEKTLEQCLPSVCKQKVKPDEIILVDNNSTDSSKEIVESFINDFREIKIVYLICEKKGPSAARNKGANIAIGDWLIFTDSDCVPSQSWISDYIAHFDKETLGAVAGCITPYQPTNLVQKTLSLFTLPENKEEVIHDNFTITKGLYPAANLAVRKKVYNLVGGFKEDLKYSEDRELCSKIYKSGYKIKAIKNAIVQHIHRTSLSGLIKQSFGFGTGHPYKLRYLSQGTIIFSLPFVEINKEKPGKYIWIDLIQADKKLFLLFLLGLLWWPFYLFIPAHFLYLCRFIHQKTVEKNINTKTFELPALALLLILKSFCLTCGRISHSFKHHVFCL